MDSAILLIDKPRGITSRETLVKVQENLKCEKLSHCGTLDPLATGLLVAMTGKAIKLQELLTKQNKEYQVCIELGATSDTDDADGNISYNSNVIQPSKEQIQKCLPQFIGTIEQVPPQYSSVRINGKRAHRLARKGKKVEIPARQVTIESINFISYEYPYLNVVVQCSSGTYIRSLARDIGERLNTGGYVKTLRRSKLGSFSVTNSVEPVHVSKDSCLPIEEAISCYPRVDITIEEWMSIRLGKKIGKDVSHLGSSPVTFLWCQNKVVAIAKIKDSIVSAKKLLIGNKELP